MKKCNKCNIEKPLKDFSKDKSRKDNTANRCKECMKVYTNQNKEYYINYDKIYRANNKESKSLYCKEYTQQNKEILKQYYKEYHQKEDVKQRRKGYESKYYKINKPKIINYHQKEDVKQRRRERYKIKYQNNVQFRLRHIFRSIIYHSFKNQNIKKPKETIKLLDMSPQYYKVYLESQFLPEFTWENHGVIWEIDHIKPISSFDLTYLEQIKECFHYTNTRPIFKTTEIALQHGYKDQIGNRNKSKK